MVAIENRRDSAVQTPSYMTLLRSQKKKTKEINEKMCGDNRIFFFFVLIFSFHYLKLDDLVVSRV